MIPSISNYNFFLDTAAIDCCKILIIVSLPARIGLTRIIDFSASRLGVAPNFLVSSSTALAVGSFISTKVIFV